MPLTSLNPNLLGQDSTGASKLNTAGGTVQLHSTGVFTIANNSANNFAVANNGNVGVGITAPTTTLHTKAPAFTDGIITIDATSTNVSQRLNLAANGTIQTQLYDDASQTILKSVTAKPLYLGANNSNIITVAANGNIGIGTSSPASLLDITGNDPTLRFTDNAGSPASTWSIRSNDGLLSFRDVTNGADRVVIGNTGNFGIGTTSPNALLTATQNIAADAFVDVYQAYSASPYAAYLRLNTANQTGSRYSGIVSATGGVTQWQITGGGSDSTIVFGTGSSATERMRLAANGNVGIGTSSPGAKVDVAGAIRLKGYQGAAGTLGDGYNASRFWIELQGYAANQVTQKLFYADDNAAFKITYIGHWYNAGAGSASMLRAVEFYGAIGSGGAGETGLDYYFVNAANYGTAGNTDTPSFSISGDAYVQITYGTSSSTSINSRGILVEWFGSGLPTFHSSVNAPT